MSRPLLAPRLALRSAPLLAPLLLLAAWGCAAPSSDPVVPPRLDPADDDDSVDDDDADDDDSGAGDDDSAGDDDDATPLPWPDLPHLYTVVDLARDGAPVWASLVLSRGAPDAPEFRAYGYADTAASTDFWVASTIKVYTATAALMILAQDGLSLDTQATFARRASSTQPWTEDVTVSVRRMIADVFDHSSNEDYTLLLRLAGLDWLNTVVFTEEHGLSRTALMVPYVTERPHRYDRYEEQRIVLRDGATVVERTHLWSGTNYDDLVGCEFRYGTWANCSPPSELAEHLRRLRHHAALPEGERFPVDPAQLAWMLDGDAQDGTMSTPRPPFEDGILRVLPAAVVRHKEGQVSDFALDVHAVDDAATDTHFVAAVVTESTSTDVYVDVSEALTRMLVTPRVYLHLDWLVDDVNPVEADLWVHAEVPGTLELIVKPYAEDPDDPAGWTPLPGATADVPPGDGWRALVSSCLPPSYDGWQHVRGRFTPVDGGRVATSDLHYVVVDAEQPCP